MSICSLDSLDIIFFGGGGGGRGWGSAAEGGPTEKK